MKYVNDKTGAIIETTGTISGNGWRPVVEEKPAKEKMSEPKKKGAEKK